MNGKQALGHVLMDYIGTIARIKRLAGIKAKLPDLPEAIAQELSALRSENEKLKAARAQHKGDAA